MKKNYQEIFSSALIQNRQILFLTDNIEKLGLKNYYIGGGAVAQTVWNFITGRKADYGIEDYDIIYFDDSDLSYEAEDIIIKKASGLFKNIKTDIKNQARVHLWYKEKFSKEILPYSSSEEAIDSWPSTATSIGIKSNFYLYAPFGVDDIFELKIRPNKKLITEDIFYKKAYKWKEKWPELEIIKW